MTIIASCGHDVTNSESVSLKTMDFTTDWDEQKMIRCIRLGTYCLDCANAYEDYGIVLHSKTEEASWLSGLMSYPVIDIHA